MRQEARFITLEGGDGAGKTTQIKMLADRLRQLGMAVVQTREPGGCASSEAIRDLLVKGAIDRWSPHTEVLLHYAARREHLGRIIWPAMQLGQWVISDRFSDSTFAYQGYGMGLDLDFIHSVHAAVVGDFAPDLTIVLDIDPDAGVRRSKGHSIGENRYEEMDQTFHKKLRDGFLSIATDNPARCVVLDASRDIDTVHQNIWKIVSSRLMPQ